MTLNIDSPAQSLPGSLNKIIVACQLATLTAGMTSASLSFLAFAWTSAIYKQRRLKTVRLVWAREGSLYGGVDESGL